jgi:predicted DNA-binding transcriptional regulator AlpA
MYASIKEAGLLMTGELCRRLGISETTYHRLESGGIFPRPRRWGRWFRPTMRVFATCEIDRLRRLLARTRRQRRRLDTRE